MRLHQNKTLFRQAVAATALWMDIPEIYIEKDYWVSYALCAIFSDTIGEETIFKGGTALSKCFGLVERFSEDIDLVVLRRDSDTGNQLKEKIKRIGAVVSAKLPEVQVEGLTRRMGMNRKTAHGYPREFVGDSGQVRESLIVVEATWLGSFEPYTTLPIKSYIAEMMIDRGQQALIDEYGLEEIEAKVLRPERTLCEKIMSLVRFSYGEHAIQDLKLKIRHIYDLHQMLQHEEIKAFFESEFFGELLHSVANNDVVSYKSNNAWLARHPKNALIFRDLENTWTELAPAYRGDFSNLVFGTLPSDTNILATLSVIKTRLRQIHWNVTIPNLSDPKDSNYE